MKKNKLENVEKQSAHNDVGSFGPAAFEGASFP